jgi:hypothetical protein
VHFSLPTIGHAHQWSRETLAHATFQRVALQGPGRPTLSTPHYNVLPRTTSSKRAFIAALIAGVHRMMVGRSILIRTALFKSSVLEPPPAALDVDISFQENEDVGLDNELLIKWLLWHSTQPRRSNPHPSYHLQFP